VVIEIVTTVPEGRFEVFRRLETDVAVLWVLQGMVW
jgi:hypothetical protein